MGLPSKESDQRLRKFLALASGLAIQTPEVDGLDQLQMIPANQPVIFAVSHITDVDVLSIAAEVLNYRSLDVASAATNQADPIFGTVMKFFGIQDRFLDISNTYDRQTKTPVMQFAASDFARMAESIRQGKDVVIAAHNAIRDGRLPEKGGVGAIYLAQLTGAPIVPIALTILGGPSVGMAADVRGSIGRLLFNRRPRAIMRIGQPINLEPISKELLEEWAARRGNAAALSAREQLRQQSSQLMHSLSSLLPPEKR